MREGLSHASGNAQPLYCGNQTVAGASSCAPQGAAAAIGLDCFKGIFYGRASRWEAYVKETSQPGGKRPPAGKRGGGKAGRPGERHRNPYPFEENRRKAPQPASL